MCRIDGLVPEPYVAKMVARLAVHCLVRVISLHLIVYSGDILDRHLRMTMKTSGVQLSDVGRMKDFPLPRNTTTSR